MPRSAPTLRSHARRGAATIVWFRHDLRTADHAALSAAAALGPVVPLFIWSPDEDDPWPVGSAARVWLAESLRDLSDELAALGSPLIFRHGPVKATLRSVVQASRAQRVFWSRRYEPGWIERDNDIGRALQAEGVAVQSFPGALLFEPGEVLNGSGLPYRVFTPFAKKCLARAEPSEMTPSPARLSSVQSPVASVPLDELGIAPQMPWCETIRAAWTPGASAGKERLAQFAAQPMNDYESSRNLPAADATSRLSPYLHWGEISPRQVWHAVEDQRGRGGRGASDHQLPAGAEAFRRQLLWREFAQHLLLHFPHTDREPLRPEFANFPWQDDPQRLRAWQRGRTGYPVVDAGMRQLWQTGWMHNRLRMIVASFLVKDLLIPWQRGAEWFWDTLVDADLANNTLGWQWAAGCGADAAPYFRIFNPVTQGLRFDPQGDYVRRWVPELSQLPEQFVHEPWKAPAAIRSEAEVQLGGNYPHRIIDHAAARSAALEAFGQIRGRGTSVGNRAAAAKHRQRVR